MFIYFQKHEPRRLLEYFYMCVIQNEQGMFYGFPKNNGNAFLAWYFYLYFKNDPSKHSKFTQYVTRVDCTLF